MEEQRIGMMYWNALVSGLRRKWEGLFPRGLRRSAALPALVITALIVIPGVGWYLHIYGKFSSVKQKMGVDQAPPPPQVARPGGVEPLVLNRTATLGGNMPEFLTATLLPGLGMDVLQITASLPDRGEVPLLVAPTASEVADNTLGPRNGANDDHGALEAPWSGSLSGLISPIGTSLTTSWRGHTLSVARDPQERPGLAEGGLLNTLAADDSGQTSGAMGPVARATFTGTDFGGHWLSKTDVKVGVQLSARTLDITVTAQNTGSDPEPMGIGWHPRFAIPSGNRGEAELRLPMGEKLEIGDRARGIPTGRMVALDGAASRFEGHSVGLGTEAVDETLVHMKPALMDSGNAVEYRDPASGFGLRMTALSTSIKALHVVAPADAPYVSLGMQTNYDDALGKEWTGEDGGGLVTLQPGQELEWKVRLEIFAVTKR